MEKKVLRSKTNVISGKVAAIAGVALIVMAAAFAVGGPWMLKGGSASATVQRLQEEYTGALSSREVTEKTTVKFNVDSVASLAVTDTDMWVTPSGEQRFVTGNSKVRAMVKADAGYTILMTSEDSTLPSMDSDVSIPTIVRYEYGWDDEKDEPLYGMPGYYMLEFDPTDEEVRMQLYDEWWAEYQRQEEEYDEIQSLYEGCASAEEFQRYVETGECEELGAFEGPEFKEPGKSSWAYHVGALSGEVDNSDDLEQLYLPIPGANETETLSDQSGDDEDYVGWEEMDLGYAVSVDPTLQSGSYIRTVTITAVGKIWSGNLEVRPNGGTWTHDGTDYTNTTVISDLTGAEIAVENPVKVANITYEYDNSASDATVDMTGATTSGELQFTGWDTGATVSTSVYNEEYDEYEENWDMQGKLEAKNNAYAYTFGKGSNDYISAKYDKTTIVLPTIEKQYYNCRWNNNYDSGASANVSGDTTFRATCSPKQYNAKINTDGSGTLIKSANGRMIPYDGTNSVTITPVGAKIIGASCTNGYTITPAAAGQKSKTTFTIQHPGGTTETGTTCTFTGEERDDASFVDVSYMQDVESCPASKVTANTQYTLKDKRDEKEYKVARIGSQCWMTTNLNIAGGTEMSSELTNLPDGLSFTLPSSDASSFRSNSDGAAVYNDADDTGEGTGGDGGYYSFKAAVAGYDIRYQYGVTIEERSICPKRWRLPSVSDFETLISVYDTTEKIAASPWYLKYSGIYDTGYHSDNLYRLYAGRIGRYWTNKLDPEYSAIYLNADNDSASLSIFKFTGWGGARNTGYGQSIRCIWSGY